MPLKKAWLEAGGLDLNYNCASAVCLASNPPCGSFDVCAFSQLEDFVGKWLVWQEEGTLLALCRAGSEQWNVPGTHRAQSHLKETLMVSRRSS